MDVVETRTSLWEVLRGRAPGTPTGPADPDLWRAVADRLNPARARPRLRDGIEEVAQTSLRGERYLMLRSPDPQASYLRLAPEERELAHRMDGSRTVAVLVGEFARISGQLSPDRVLRLVADLAGNRMLDELPVDAFRPLRRARSRGLPLVRRTGAGVLAAARGQRMVLANPDRLAGVLYRAGGRLLFTRAAAFLLAVVILAGLALFVATWIGGAQSIFLVGDSYLLGALVLLGLNVVALSCHELGHALAAKHAGRRVPAAGILLYFGLPSVFVDTTDVWMASRRDRLRASLAGPVAALTVAGVGQLVALAYPGLAPLAFKLAFVWYLNTLFNLNPLLALDGYYALMDWLEIPNLRPRAIATLVSWARRRRPRWSELDREGRLVAVYAVLALLWLVVMANLLVRLHRDRVTGVVTGLWQLGWAARLLLVVVAAALVAPLVYAVAGWLGRRWRRLRARLPERRRARDVPRRLRALSGSVLGALPAPQLTTLATNARWVHPRVGAQVLAAGAAPHDVLLVVDGELVGRRPGDPPGAVRARAGAGELAGAAAALSARPSALSWHAAGTTLLAVPTRDFRAVVGPLVTPVAVDPDEAQELLAESAALAGLPDEERAGLSAQMRPLALSPGEQLELAGPQEAVLVAAGTLASEGGEVRRGQLIGPAGPQEAVRAQARSPVRAWVFPVMASLASALARGRSAAPASASSSQVATVGLHTAGGYPPLSRRPGPPPAGDEKVDRHLMRRLCALALMVLLLALFTGRIAVAEDMPWTEMPRDRVLLSIEQGSATAAVDGRRIDLHRGDQRFLGAGDGLRTDRGSRGVLTFFGGGAVLVCPASEVTVGRLATDGDRPVQPSGQVRLLRGTVVADTTGHTAAVEPLRLTAQVGRHRVGSEGPARFAVTADPRRPVAVAAGRVALDGRPQPISDHAACPAGPAGTVAPAVTPSPATSPTPTSTPSPTPSPSPTPTPSTAPTPTPSPTPPPPPPPPPNVPPEAVAVVASPDVIRPASRDGRCEVLNPGVATVSAVTATVADADDPPDTLAVTFAYVLSTDASVAGTVAMAASSGGSFTGDLGPFEYGAVPSGGGILTIRVTVVDPSGAEATSDAVTVVLSSCEAEG